MFSQFIHEFINVLHFLSKEQIAPDDIIYEYFTEGILSKIDLFLSNHFLPEIKTFIHLLAEKFSRTTAEKMRKTIPFKCQRSKIVTLMSKKAEKSFQRKFIEISPEFDQKRKIGENDSYICELTRQDSVDEFIKYVKKMNISLVNQLKFEIKEEQFKGCQKLTQIKIPSKITKIGKKVFEFCISLKQILFENGSKLERFDDFFFFCCISLVKISILPTTKTISENSFENYLSLNEIKF